MKRIILGKKIKCNKMEYLYIIYVPLVIQMIMDSSQLKDDTSMHEVNTTNKSSASIPTSCTLCSSNSASTPDLITSTPVKYNYTITKMAFNNYRINDQASEKLYSNPVITLDNVKQDLKGNYFFSVSCTVSTTRHFLLDLSLRCDDMTQGKRRGTAGPLSITVMSVHNFTDCSCTASYSSGPHIDNRIVREVLFAGNSLPFLKPDYFPIPEIYIHSLEQFGNNTFRFDVSCSTLNITHLFLALSLECDQKAKISRPGFIRLISITVSSENNSTDCSCNVTYLMGNPLYSRNVRKVLFTDNFYPNPEITQHSSEQEINGSYIYYVSCSVSNISHLIWLSFRCGQTHESERHAATGMLFLNATSVNNSIECACLATYASGSHLTNRRLRTVVFAESVYQKPEIYLHNFEQDVKGHFIFHVYCMASKIPHHPMALSISCDHIEKYDKPPGISGIISLMVTSKNNSMECNCTATYDARTHLYNSNVHKVLFADNVISQQIFYVASVSENGTNITVRENQAVTFVCLPYRSNKDSLRLHRGTQLIKNAFLNFSHLYTIDRVKCNDSGEYRCKTVNSKENNLSSVILSVQCDTYNCTDTEECPLNGSVYSSSCWNTTRSSQLCPVPCISCHIDLPDTNATFSNHIFTIALSVSGAVIVSGLVVIFFLMKARDQMIERHFDNSTTSGIHRPIMPRNNTLRQNDSNSNGHSETHVNRPHSSQDGERSDYVNPIYVPWNPSCDVGTSKRLILRIYTDDKTSPSEAHT